MTEKDSITSEKVKKSGLFDFKELYQFTYRWLDEEGYDIEEEKYQEGVKADSKDLEIVWKCQKKLSDYFRSEIKLVWRIVGMKSVEVERDGKRSKTNDGSFEIKISGTLARDYENKWDKNPFARFLRGIYDRYIIEGTLKGYRGKVFGEVNDLAEQIKAFLTLEGMK